jgi:cell division protein FtsL
MKLVMIVLLVVFSFFYLSQSSQSATRNYVISDLEEQKEKTEAVKAQLEVDGNRLKALSLIQDKAKEKGMEQISQ